MWRFPVSAVGVIGIAVAIAVPVLSFARMRDAERRAIEMLTAIREAQAAFRIDNGGYATDLESLIALCRDRSTRLHLPGISMGDGDAHYHVSIRAANHARSTGRDCHGRVTATDYYASAAPRENGVDGRRAMAMTAVGPMFVFFDGMAPREADMEAGGLAVPLESLDTFKIP